MPQLLFGRGAYRRDYGNLPELQCVNLYAESSPTSEGGVVLQCRKGLTSHATRGTGPINGIFSEKGVFSDDLFVISNNTAYRGSSSLGTVLGSGPVSWAASDTEIVVTRGGPAYSYNGTNLSAVSFPDGADVTAVAYIASLFIFIRADSHKFYWSNVLDARTVESLDFASAELMPDKLKDVKAIRGTLYLFGEGSVEPWAPSGNVDLPFTRIDQRLFTKGIYDTGCVAAVDDSLIFVSNDCCVYRLADVPERISNHGIEERIADSTSVSCFTFETEGHKFFCVRLDEMTLCFDTVTGEWCEFATYGRTNWRARNAINVGKTPYFGDDTGGTIWTFGTTFKDDSAQLEAYFTALKPIEGAETFDNVRVICNVGQTQPLSGDDASPVIEMRTSTDAGNTFGDWKEASLGAQGAYRTRAMWRRVGMFDSPGALLEFRITDQSPRRISAVEYNVPGGGRSR